MNSARNQAAEPASKPLWVRLQPLFGLLMLAVVGWFLPWRDRLVVPDPAHDSDPALIGRIEGDWQSDQVHFVFDAQVPEALGSRLSGSDGALALTRAPSGQWNSAALAQDVELRPGLPRIFRSVEPFGLATAMGFFFLALLCGVTRWWRLLGLSGAGTRWIDCFRLTFLGLFFNLVVPGLTGGDVVKAILAVRENPGRRTDALISVVVDRLFGLFSLVLLAAVVIASLGDTFIELRLPVLALAVCMAAAALMYVHPAPRRWVRFDALLAKLPFHEKLEQLDRAVLLYAKHPAEVALALLLSLGNHFGATAGVMALGTAFGVAAGAIGFWDWVAIVPVANIISSVPVAPGGWGVGEAAYGFLFKMIGQSAALGVAVSIGFRLCQLLLGVIGGLYLLRPAQRRELAEIEP